MIRFWTERARRMQAALEHHVSLRVAFTVYSFITLFLCAPTPALAPQVEISPASASLGSGATAFNCDIPRETLFLPGGDPAALENGDSFSQLRRQPIHRLRDTDQRPASNTCP